MSNRFKHLMLLSLSCSWVFAQSIDYPVDRNLYRPGSYAGRTFYYDRVHLGEDVALTEGTAIRAIASGRIVHYDYAGGYATSNDGTSIAAVIEHDLGRSVALNLTIGDRKTVTASKICSIYGHIRKSQTYSGIRLTWRAGDWVNKGDVIGYVNDADHNGDGGVHLHLAVRLGAHPGRWVYYGYDTRPPDSSVSNFAAASEVIQQLSTNLRVIDFWQKNGNGQYTINCYGDNFLDAQFKVVNDGSSSISLDRVVLAVHKQDGSHLLDIRSENDVTISAGNTYQFQRSFLSGVHDGLVPGSYKLVAKILRSGAWFDLASLDFSILTRSYAPCAGSPTNLPDLVTTAFTTPRTATQGVNLTGTSVTVRNQGTGNAGPFQIGYFFSRNSVVTTSDVDTGWRCRLNQGLAAGASTSCSGEVGVPSGLASGTYYLAAIADSLNEVTESDKSNNGRVSDSGAIIVGNTSSTPPAPAEITGPVPGATFDGSTVTFTWTGGNRVTEYHLRVGASTNGKDYYDQNQGAGRSRSVLGLPLNGSTIYVRISSHYDNGDWYANDYTYQAASIRGGTGGYPESPHPYPDNYDNTWTYTYPASVAAVDVTFDSQTRVEEGWDSIYVMDVNGNNIPGSPFTGTSLAGQTKSVPGSTVKIRLSTDGSVNYWGFKVTNVGVGTGGGPATNRRTVFLIHGLAQSGGAMDALGITLRDPVFGIDRNRFGIDAGFDYGDCANTVFCSADCTIQAVARRLGQYIKLRNPEGDIILVGYSLGGLVARDLMLNNYFNVFDNRRVAALITLGTPNVGYPYSSIDDNARCSSLIQQMSSNFRSRQSDNLVMESRYLYDLNSSWGATSFLGQPRSWLVAAGTFCTDATRTLDRDQGCPDSNTASDGVVCDQSARFRLNVSGNKPTSTWSDSNYAHTDNGASWTVLCGNWDGRYHTLFNPPASGALVKAIKEMINGL